MSQATPPAAAPAPPAPGTPAYDAAMVAKFEASQAPLEGAPAAPPPAPAARPEGVPEKFWDAAKGQVNTEALLKSYAELEKARAPAATPAAAPAAAPAPAPAEGQPPAPDAAAAKAAVGPEVFEALSAEYAEKGELSAESIAKLEQSGIPKPLVDQYIAGVKALEEATLNQGYSLAGGKDQYAQMLQWAGTNLNAAEIAAFDAAVVGSPASMAQAILGLKARYEATYGQTQNLVTNTEPNKGALGYQSQAEMTADMKDPRYKVDAAFRRSVEQKLAVTTAF